MLNRSKAQSYVIASKAKQSRLGLLRHLLRSFLAMTLNLHSISTLLLIGLAISERLWFDLGANVELITLVTLIAALYFGRKTAVIVALTSLALSDLVIGNKPIMLFTWSAYALIAIVAYFIGKFAKNPVRRVGIATVSGAVASLWFYLWTNFGVWLMDSFNMYPNDLSGLMRSYIAGLPFLRNQLVGNLLIVPIGFIVLEFLLIVYHSGQQRKQYVLT